jgi:hypothetical protein
MVEIYNYSETNSCHVFTLYICHALSVHNNTMLHKNHDDFPIRSAKILRLEISDLIRLTKSTCMPFPGSDRLELT